MARTGKALRSSSSPNGEGRHWQVADWRTGAPRRHTIGVARPAGGATGTDEQQARASLVPHCFLSAAALSVAPRGGNRHGGNKHGNRHAANSNRHGNRHGNRHAANSLAASLVFGIG